MKKFICTFLLLAVLFAFCSYSVLCASSKSAESVSEIIRRQAPEDFGYLDNTEYYMQYYFSELSFVDDACIVACNESTNFNEFGVFHVKSESNIKPCVKVLQSYLQKAKARFKSGIVYDVQEYPKFENAKVTVIGQYVIYTILDSKQSKAALDAVKNFLQ